MSKPGMLTRWDTSKLREGRTQEVSWVTMECGRIPECAVLGGMNPGGPTYVGRARHEGHIIPGKILVNHRVCYYGWGGSEFQKSNYEALSIPRGLNYAWKKSSNGGVPRGAIPGGSTEAGEQLYIARANHSEYIVIGKVHPSHHVCYIPWFGKEVGKKEYEVLVVKGEKLASPVDKRERSSADENCKATVVDGRGTLIYSDESKLEEGRTQYVSWRKRRNGRIPEHAVSGAMMDEVNPIVVKVFLIDSNVTQEVRRFDLCPEVRPCFSVIKHHVIRAFPHLQKEEFVIAWRDREGDEVRINSDEELRDAMFETRHVKKTDIFKIYVLIVPTKSSTIKTDGEYHQHVVCDGCEGNVKGFRYKCLQCPDFDLCSKCEGNGVHANHNMMRLVHPVFFGHPWRQFMRRCLRFFPVYENGTWSTPDVEIEERREKQKRRYEEEEKETYGSSHTDESSSSSERERSSHSGKKSKQHTSNRSSDPPPFTPFSPFSEIMNGFWTDLSGGCPATPPPPTPHKGFQPPVGLSQPSVEMLHNIGQHVRNILDPLGVNVYVDVQHKVKRTCSKNKKGTDGKSKKEDDTEMETTEKPAEKENSAQEGKAEAKNAPDSCETVAEGVAAMQLDDKDDSSEDVMKDYVVLNSMASRKPNEKGDWQMYCQLGEELQELASAPSTENVQRKEASPDNMQTQELTAEKVQTQEPATEKMQTQEPSTKKVQTQKPVAEKVQTLEAAAEKMQTRETSFEKAVEATEEMAEAAGKTPPEPKVSHLDPKVAKALGQMLSMGFTNEGGWLAQLLEVKRGDIGQALDVLIPQ